MGCGDEDTEEQGNCPAGPEKQAQAPSSGAWLLPVVSCAIHARDGVVVAQAVKLPGAVRTVTAPN